MAEDRLEERTEICAFRILIEGSDAPASRTEENRRFQLFIGGVEVDEKFQYFIDDFVDSAVGTIDFVDDDDDFMTQLQRFGENEPRLRHRSFRGIHEQYDTVDHLENAFDFAAEIRVSRRVDDIDLYIIICYSGIFRKNRNTPLSFEIVGIHDSLHYRLVFAVDAALLEHFIHECRLAVIDVCDDGDVSEIRIYQ